mmetsp:Transcript_82472/g.237091  ORF Transcript_82472/g.237091 Transcript_82472/m.237091 type:complete len:279 (-) Transcript_82472:839-1675(-)
MSPAHAKHSCRDCCMPWPQDSSLLRLLRDHLCDGEATSLFQESGRGHGGHEVFAICLDAVGHLEAGLLLNTGLHRGEKEGHGLEVCDGDLVAGHEFALQEKGGPHIKGLGVSLVGGVLIGRRAAEAHGDINNVDVLLVHLTPERVHCKVDLPARGRVRDRVVFRLVLQGHVPEHGATLAHGEGPVLQRRHVVPRVHGQKLGGFVGTAHEVTHLHFACPSVHGKHGGSGDALRRRHAQDLDLALGLHLRWGPVGGRGRRVQLLGVGGLGGHELSDGEAS